MKLLIAIRNKVIKFYILQPYSMRQLGCCFVFHHGATI